MLAKCLSLLLAATLALPGASPASRLRTGEYLRLHVIAQDDTDAMQAVKAPVRDAVRDAYRSSGVRTGSMLLDAALLLPTLTRAAQDGAQDAGFDGAVDVRLTLASLDARTLEGCAIPAGRYPALMIRLGDARGHNWWGLLDPETSLAAAALPGAKAAALEWDWSLHGLLTALFGWMGGLADAE